MGPFQMQARYGPMEQGNNLGFKENFSHSKCQSTDSSGGSHDYRLAYVQKRYPVYNTPQSPWIHPRPARVEEIAERIPLVLLKERRPSS